MSRIESDITKIRDELASTKTSISDALQTNSEKITKNSAEIEELKTMNQQLLKRIEDLEKRNSPEINLRPSFLSITSQQMNRSTAIPTTTRSSTTPTPIQTPTTNTRPPPYGAQEQPSSPLEAELTKWRKKVGFFPISTDDIRWNYVTKPGDKDPWLEEEEDIARGERYDSARIATANEFVEKELGLKKGEVKIVEVKMCKNTASRIMWVTMEFERDVKLAFIQAAKINNKGQIQVKNAFPPCTFDRKNAIEKIMKARKASDPNLRWKLEVGRTDLRLSTKTSRFGIYEFLPLEVLEEDLPPISFSQKVSVEGRARPRAVPDSKHKASSPAASEAASKKPKDDEESDINQDDNNSEDEEDDRENEDEPDDNKEE